MKLLSGFCGVVLAGVLGTAAAGAAYPSGYYDSLNGKCGVALMRAVKNAVAAHTAIPYGASTWKAFEDTDVKKVDGKSYWWDMYSNNLVLVSSGHPGMNIEHSVANSWWGKTTNDAYKDIVHLNPSDADANNRKGNYPLAELQSVTWTNGVTSVGKAKSGQGGGAGTCYEPADEYKGDFARVFMYMFTVYDDISWKSNTAWMYDAQTDLMFKPWARELLLRWNAGDPVSDKERSRNDGVYKNQKNRNPFIDLPDLADHIWGAKADVPFSVEDSGDPVVPPVEPGDHDPDADRFDWLSATASDVGDWDYEDVTLPSGGSYVWSWKEYDGKHYLNASAYIGGTPYASKSYAWSPEVSMKNVVKADFSFSHAAKFQTTLRTLCKVAVKDLDSGLISEVEIPSWPSAGKWDFAGSGNVDLSRFAGKRIRVGFKYESSASGADTWEIRDARLELARESAGAPSVEDSEDDSFLVEVWGNTICVPEGARIFDLQGREYGAGPLARGVYVVVKPTFERSVKVIVK